MTETDTPQTLTGKLLIAMPGMGDPRFDRAVVMLCAHSGEGAMGLIINKRVPQLMLDDLLEQLDIARGEGSQKQPVYFGGPVEGGRGFVLHSLDEPRRETTMRIGETFGMTATKDILVEIAGGTGPHEALTALGYTGWGPGQLESELQQNAWLMVDADPGLVFDTADTEKWARALKKLGIDPLMLSAEGGRA